MARLKGGRPWPVVQGQKWKAMVMVLTTTKCVHIASSLIDLEEELEHTSYLLEEVQDEAIAAAEQVRVVDAHILQSIYP